MLCNNGDWILTEDHTYSGTIEAARILGLKLLGVDMDEDGLIPEILDSKLQNWGNGLGPKPRILCTVPLGQNPTGANQTLPRRKAIYAIAEKHDTLIIEDDPYYFIQLREAEREGGSKQDPPHECDKYLQALPASYLALDVSGRVIRLDSTSKILALGLRCSWMTGCSQLIEKFINHTELSTSNPSGPSQVMLYKLLDETWDHLGFITWLRHLSSEYGRRCRIILEACNKHLPQDLCSWVVPEVGMFLWIRLLWRRQRHRGRGRLTKKRI